ncbi:MAG: phosphate acyltransferase PlsX [Bdellovibrionales bacterium]
MFEAPNSGITKTGLTVALDCMGGDNAPASVIEGADIARLRFPGAKFLLFGDETLIRPLLAKYPQLVACSEVRHTADSIGNEVKAAVALRQGRSSSMRLAINAVAEGEASCVVSAGNTGALMAMAKFVMKTLPGIDRPAIATFFPTQTGESVMLDMGANVDCEAKNYVEFAIMGALFARTVLGIINPRIGLLNIGSEEMKGHDTLRDAFMQLKNIALPGSFLGFIEGNDIGAGRADVIVTDGFSGNVALKTIEGTARMITHFIRESFRHSIFATIGYIFARGTIKRLKERIDPRRYNGAMFLGLKGVCVKSHGGTDAFGFASAIGVAIDLVKQDFNGRIHHELEKMGPLTGLNITPAVPLAMTETEEV